MKRISLFIVVLTILVSCKKTKLKGDLEVFTGEWEWIMTENITGNHCENVSIRNPNTEGYTYKLKFEPKGILRIYKNGEKQKKYRLVYAFQRDIVSGSVVEYAFYLNNKKDNITAFRITKGSPDTLSSSFYPIEVTGSTCFDKENIFIRQ